jgi:hypothetical protein
LSPLTSLLAIENIARVVRFEGIRIGVTFRFPSPIVLMFIFTPAGAVGMIVGVLVAAPVNLALTAATMVFVRCATK